MQKRNNIYRRARMTAGMTQARFAEEIGVSVEAVAKYESGAMMPDDDVVLAMIDVADYRPLAYWHLQNKSLVAAELLPQVKCVPVAQAVVNLIHELKRFEKSNVLDLLTEMAADGAIDSREKDSFAEILTELDGIIQAAFTVKYCRESEPEED